jgi:hypothetical protein
VAAPRRGEVSTGDRWVEIENRLLWWSVTTWRDRQARYLSLSRRHQTTSSPREAQHHILSHLFIAGGMAMAALPSRRRFYQTDFTVVVVASMLLISSSVVVASAFGNPRNMMMNPGQSHIRHFGVQQPKRYCSTFAKDDDDVVLLLDEESTDKDRETIDDDDENDDNSNGTVEGYIVTQQYRVPIDGFPDAIFSPEDASRLQLKPNNVTLAVALMLLDPEKYPTQSRARKAIR